MFKRIVATALASFVICYSMPLLCINNNSTYISSFASTESEEELRAPTIVAVPGNKKVILRWDYIFGASKYRIFMYNDVTKKYDICKTVGALNTCATISNLQNGKSYIFKVAAISDDGKCHDCSMAIKSTPQASMKMEQEEIKLSKLLGVWELYDITQVDYTEGKKYNPMKVERKFFYDSFSSIIQQFHIIRRDNMLYSDVTNNIGGYHLSGGYSFYIDSDGNTFTSGDALSNNRVKFRIYKYGNDRFMIANINRENYVLKRIKVKNEIEEVKNKNVLSGVWEFHDWCAFPLNDDYNPLYPVCPYSATLSGARVKNGKISLKKYDFFGFEKILSSKKYRVYKVKDEMYLYYTEEDDITKCSVYYVFKKTKGE